METSKLVPSAIPCNCGDRLHSASNVESVIEGKLRASPGGDQVPEGVAHDHDELRVPVVLVQVQGHSVANADKSVSGIDKVESSEILCSRCDSEVAIEARQGLLAILRAEVECINLVKLRCSQVGLEEGDLVGLRDEGEEGGSRGLGVLCHRVDREERGQVGDRAGDLVLKFILQPNFKLD